MMQFAIGASLAKELVGILGSVIESPDTYKRLDGLRSLIEKVTGKTIDKAGFLAFMEETTQGEAYTGQWETIAPVGSRLEVDEEAGRRLRVDGAWIYDIGRGNGLVVHDK